MDKNDAVYPIEGFTSGMTALAYAAIHLKVTSPDLPDWLNEMIDRSRRDDFARAAMQLLPRLTTDGPLDFYEMERVSKYAAFLRDAMMEESK